MSLINHGTSATATHTPQVLDNWRRQEDAPPTARYLSCQYAMQNDRLQRGSDVQELVLTYMTESAHMA